MKKTKTPLGWGVRFRTLAKAKGFNLRQIAEKLEMSESGVRSWTNGQRAINLEDFLALCKAAGIDPAQTLFSGQVDDKFLAIGDAWLQATPLEREVLWTTAQGILANKRGTSSDADVSTNGRRAKARPGV